MIKKGTYHGIPCLYDPVTEELGGVNWFTDLLVCLNIWLDYKVFMLEELPIWIDEDEN